MRWEKLAVISGVVIALVLVGCGDVSLDSEKKSKVDPAPGPSVSKTFELPLAGNARKPEGGEELLEVLVKRSGAVWVLGKENDNDALKEMLFELADAKRDLDHPSQPSLLGVVIRANRRAPWKKVLEVFESFGDPAIRIFRIYLAVGTGEGDEEGVIQAFLPKDRGLAKTRVKLTGGREIRVRMGGELPGEHTSVRVLDVPFILDPAGEKAVRELIAEIHARDKSLIGRIVAGEDVPWGDVVRVYDMFVSAGVTMHGNYLMPWPVESQLENFTAALGKSTAAEAEKQVREKLGIKDSGFAGALFDDKTGLTDVAWLYLTEKVGATQALTLLEPLVIPDPENRERVRDLLETQEHSRRELAELVSKIEPSYPLLVAVARLSAARGGLPDALRALTLLQLVSVDPEHRYGERWWHAQLILLRLYDQIYRDFELEQARTNVVNLVNEWRNLGVLERSPVRGEILKLESAAKR